MKGFFSIACAFYSVFALLAITQSQDIEDIQQLIEENCAETENCCPYGTTSGLPVDEQLCYRIIRFFDIMYGQCRPYTGDALDYTYLGDQIAALDQITNNTCPTYDDSDTVVDCLAQNDTLTSNLCMAWWVVAYNARSNCSDFYTIDPCEIPPIGQQAIDHYTDPADECTPAPYYTDCQIMVTCDAMPCPNCAISPCPISS